MPFQPDDFYVGMIAYFAVADLRRQRDIATTTPTFDKKPRPFVCYDEADGLTYWACFTTTPKPWRRAVDRNQVRYPAGRSAFTLPPHDLIVSEGRDSYVGPVEAFARCSHKHDRFGGIVRPVLLREGLEQVRAIVRTSGGLLPETVAAALATRAAGNARAHEPIPARAAA